jgi:putative permease
LMKSIIGATFTLFGMVVDLVIVVFLGVYWSIDQVHFERLWLSLLPVERRRAARDLWQTIEVEVGAYVRSEGVQTIAAGVLLWLGYRALGQPYPVLLALVGAVAWLIPWVGVLLAVGAVTFFSAPALAIDFRAALTPLVLSILYTSVVLLVLQRYVEPRFFDRRRYNALVTAVIIFGMADVAGLMGLVLGAPLAAALEIAVSHWMRLRLSPANEPARQPSFEERLLAVRTALDGRQQAAPGLVNLVDRLTALVEEADDLLSPPSADENPLQNSHLVADARAG